MYLYKSSAVCLLALSELVLYTVNRGLLIDTALHLPHSFFSYNKPIPVPRFFSITWEHFGIIGRFSQSWCTFCCPADSVKAVQRTQSTDLSGRNSPTAERVLLPFFIPAVWHLYAAITGRIHIHTALTPVYKLLSEWFWGFSSCRSDIVHRWGWNLAWRSGSKSTHPCQISLPLVQGWGVGPQRPKIVFLGSSSSG